MLIALYHSKKPVQVADDLWITSLGRENLTQHYVGGEGYTGCKAMHAQPDDIDAAIQLDPETCEPLRNWLDAMAETDRVCEQDWPNVAAALELEDEARAEFVKYVHDLSLARANTARETSPNSPPSIPAFLFWEGEYEDVHASGMALQGARG
jgi:hypothetical protein